MKKLLGVLLFALIANIPAKAQLPVSLELPRVSPFETRSITIGYTQIAFEYSSVAIRDREVWGGLVPYDQVWRIGANENTVFSVTDDVYINGNLLPAGEYGMHAIPGEETWTLIFSNFSDAWGSYFYDESEDQLRIEVTPEVMNSTYEWMKFSFENYTDTTVDMSMKWAGLKVPFTVEVPRSTTFQHIEDQFKSLPAFSWEGWYQGANYTLNYEYEMEKGLVWANNAVNRDRNVQTLTVKAGLLAKLGNEEEAIETAEAAVNEFSDQWRAFYGASTVYSELGDTDKAIEMVENAIEIAPGNIGSQLEAVLNNLRGE